MEIHQQIAVSRCVQLTHTGTHHLLAKQTVIPCELTTLQVHALTCVQMEPGDTTTSAWQYALHFITGMRLIETARILLKFLILLYLQIIQLRHG